MRPGAALLLATLLLAGCTQGDDPTPPNADPNGPPPSFPSTNTTVPTTSNPSTGMTTTAGSTSGSTPTYASSPTSAPSPGVTLSAQHQEDSATDPAFPGLIVAGQLDVSGNIAHFEASATNMGQRTYRVSSMCVMPWTESMSGASGPAQHRQPTGSCAAFGLRDFAPGDSLPFSAEWNGTLWTNGAFAPASDGTYTWTARFQVYSGGEGASYDDTATLDLQFQVTVS